MKISTEKAYIVPFEKAHVQETLNMLLEPESNRYIQPLHGKSKKELEQRLLINIEKNRKRLQFFSVFDLKNGAFIGTMNLNEFEDTKLMQIGIHLKKSYWNKGMGYMLCQSLLNYVFNDQKISEIHWVFEAKHEVSKKLALRLGFRPFKDMIYDHICVKIYKLEAHEFKTRNK